MSLQNADLKLISKALARRLKDILSDLILSKQAYMKNRYISASGRLICHVLQTASILNKKGFLVTVDDHSVDHSFY